MIPEELLMIFLLLPSAFASRFEVTHEWKYVDYDWDGFKGNKSSDYNPSAIVLYDVDFARDGRIFVTAVRQAGVPASVMTVTDAMGDGGPILKPYPSWAWYKLGDCKAITNVYRVMIDDCDLIWILDAGKVGSDTVCPPQILAFDLKTNELKFRKQIPNSMTKNGAGLLVTPVVDACEHCRNFYIYMADVEGYGIVTYNSKTDEFKRWESPLYNNDPDSTNITIQGDSFSIQDGVLGMALQQTGNQHKILHFTSLASHRLNYVPADNAALGRASVLVRNLPSQAAALAIGTRWGRGPQTLFFGQLQYTAIVCYNAYSRNGVRDLVWLDNDSKALQFPSGMKIHRYGYYDEIKIFTNRYQKVASGTFSTNETNFRILRGNVDHMIRGTKCEGQRGFPGYGFPWVE